LVFLSVRFQANITNKILEVQGLLKCQIVADTIKMNNMLVKYFRTGYTYLKSTE
jgi:hypothetical protein